MGKTILIRYKRLVSLLRCVCARRKQEPRLSQAAAPIPHIDLEKRVTARTQELETANAALHTSARNLDNILQTLVDGLVMVDPDGQIVYANPSAGQILDIYQDTMIGKYYQSREWQQIDENGDPFPTEALPLTRALSEQRQVGPIEHPIIAANGDIKWLSVNAAPLLNADGVLDGAVATFRDITVRKRIEDTQRFLAERSGAAGEDFFATLARYLAQSLQMDYVCIDRLEPDGLTATTVAVYFDGRFEDNVSYTLHDTPCGSVVGQNVCCFPSAVRHLFPHDDILQQMNAESYVGVTLWDSQGHPNGLIAIIGRRVLNNANLAEAVLQFVAVRAAGELERKQVEDALRASEERYHTFVNQSQEAIYCTEFDQPIDTSLPVEQQIDAIYENAYMSECNPAMAAMYGLPSAEAFIGQRMVDFHGGRDNPINRATFRKFIESDYRAVDSETEEVTPDGTKRFFLSNDIGILEDGKLVRIWGTAIDITIRKQMEDALRESLSEKTVLLQEVHHRVKNNLAMIISLLRLQQTTGLDATTQKQFQALEGRIHSIALIHEMLYQSEFLSRINYELYLQMLVVRLRDLSNFHREVTLAVKAPGIDMDIDLAIPCGLIVNELVTNALKYAFPVDYRASHAEACEISVAVSWDGTYYTLTVSDNGVGLPPTMEWTTQQTLGLQLIRMLGERQLKGQIELERDHGTTFRLRFTPVSHNNGHDLQP